MQPSLCLLGFGFFAYFRTQHRNEKNLKMHLVKGKKGLLHCLFCCFLFGVGFFFLRINAFFSLENNQALVKT